MGVNNSRKTDLGNYWGPNISEIIRGRNVTEKMIRANTDALRAGNFRAWLWESVEGEANCSCVRQIAGDSSEIKCLSCYGTGRIGGYKRFGFETQFFAASDTTGLILDKVEKDLQRTPHRLRLKVGETDGSLETPKFRVENPLLAPFDYRMDVFAPEPSASSVAAFFAVDDELDWRPIAELPAFQMRQGYLRFRIEINRNTAAIRSPLFEIFRVRWQVGREALLHLSRTQSSRRRDRTNWGDVESETGLRFWLGPKPILRAFLEPFNEDGSGLVTNMARQDSKRKSIDPFVEIRTGSRIGERYMITTIARSEPLGRLISQKLTVRLLLPDEIFYSIF